MGRKEEILNYCIRQNISLTAMEIIAALYPGKPQPYINELVAERKLVRVDTRPYTVHIPQSGEVLGPVSDYTKGSITRNRKTTKQIPTPCVEEAEKYLESWEHLENYAVQERALNKLFQTTYPENTQIEDVLV